MPNNLVSTPSLRKPFGLKQYPAGQQSTLPRQQFQLLYRELGFAQAKEIAAHFIRWPVWDDDRASQMAPDYLLHQWAMAEDQGKAEIAPEVEKAFKVRWENYARAINLSVMRGAAEAHREISKTTKDLFAKINQGEEPSEKIVTAVKDLSAMAQHMHNALYTAGQNFAPKKQEAAPVQIGRLMINAGPPPERKLRKVSQKRLKEAIPPTVEGVFRELPLGG